ncbi:uridine kinase family protein [Leifsonia sp. A12D58]|uniref:uridine kinase family protein n=1 Tax=Leifsonia sp. A12D58 TaxID=3397674 RepID=UPI0039DF5588
MSTTRTIIDTIEDLRSQDSSITVGVSGFGGSGKSTLTRQLTASIEGSARIRGDDFLDPDRSHQRSSDWDGVGRIRLREEVLNPFRQGQPGAFRRFDWGTRQLSAPEAIPTAQVLIVDAIGLFHPDLDGAFDLTIWVDLDLPVATARGKARDHQLGRSHDRLWDEVWVPNERDFFARFNPRPTADCLFVPA